MELHKKLSSYFPLFIALSVCDALRPTHLRWFWHTLNIHCKLWMHKDEHQFYRLNRSIRLFPLFYYFFFFRHFHPSIVNFFLKLMFSSKIFVGKSTTRSLFVIVCFVFVDSILQLLLLYICINFASW